jgi:hypothetical protein
MKKYQLIRGARELILYCLQCIAQDNLRRAIVSRCIESMDAVSGSYEAKRAGVMDMTSLPKRKPNSLKGCVARKVIICVVLV